MRALIAEDNPLESDFLHSYLLGLGFTEFITTSRLEDALATMATRAFDLIFLDLTLADSTAEKTLQRLPEVASRCGSAGIIIASGYNERALTGAMQYAHGVLAKPFTSASVERISRAVLDTIAERRGLKKKEE